MSLTLLAGSYERFIFGFSLKTLTPNPDSQTLTLTPLFSYPSHSAPLRAVAISPSAATPHLTAASAAGDESIHLYDLSSASSLSTLPVPSSTRSLSFFHPLHLLACSDDGHVYIFDWQQFLCLKSIKVSSAACMDLAVHPSGRVAVVVGRELGLVNLVRGRRSFSCRLEREVGLVEYVGLEGERFVMGGDEKLSVHDSEDARIVGELVGEKKVLCIADDAKVSFIPLGQVL